MCTEKKEKNVWTEIQQWWCPRSPARRAWPRRRRVRACQAFLRQPLGQTEGRLCVAWPVRCAAQSCVCGGSILCFHREVRTSCSWWKAVPPLVCSVDRAGRRRRSATASAASRCSTLLPGGQPLGSVRDVFEAAVAASRSFSFFLSLLSPWVYAYTRVCACQMRMPTAPPALRSAVSGSGAGGEEALRKREAQSHRG